MSGFSAEWLALREPYDRRARNAAVLDAVAGAMAPYPAITVVDLACGAGSTLQTVAPRIRARQTWRLVDNDLSLLARAAARAAPAGVSVTATPVDLNHDLEAALDGPVDLVATSALLDLVSEPWLNRLAVEVAARRLPFYAALTYDGRAEFAPAVPFDAEIVAAVNAHQHGDKGFGPDLGPDAAAGALAQFKAVGYDVVSGASDWEFAGEDQAIQRAALDGWAVAAREIRPRDETRIARWLQQRRELVMQGASSIRVGHVDFLARPRAE
jgi:hypothetical protein